MKHYLTDCLTIKMNTLLIKVFLLLPAFYFSIPGARCNKVFAGIDNRGRDYSGLVVTQEGVPVEGVTLSTKEGTRLAISAPSGKFSFEPTGSSDVLVLEKEGFLTTEHTMNSGENPVIIMQPEVPVDLLWKKLKKKFVTEAVSDVSGDQLKTIPGLNRNNVLGGRLPGLTVMQNNGEPGLESSSLYLRGLRTLGGARQTPYVLVDGYWRSDASYINPYDIENISVLKDAGSAAMFGLRGSNGIVLISTKRGRDENIRVSLDTKFGLQAPTRLPEYLGSKQYATLYNEALRNEGKTGKYDASALDAYESGIDPYNFPDIDWVKEFIKDYSAQQEYNLSLRGGNKSVLYYASAGYVENGGIYNVDKEVNTYNTNAGFSLYRLRSNIDVQITKRLKVSMEIGARQEKRNSPGLMSNSANRIFTVLYQLPPNVFPVFNQDGSIAGNSQYTNNPYGLLNFSGYSVYTVRNTDAATRLSYDLDFITKGLSFRGAVSFDSYFEQTISRNKGFVVYEGSLLNERGVKNPATQQNSSSVGDNQRIFDMQAGFDYNRDFGKHYISGNLFANQISYAGDGSVMPHYYQGIIGRANYAFNDRYLLQFSFSLQGSEQTSDNHRYVFFPAVSAGWILTEESFLKNRTPLVNFLKIRASHGLTGNDSNIGYFQKLSFFEKTGSYLIGESLASYGGYREGALGSPDISCEKTTKTNIGIDGSFFSSHVSLTTDLFYEKTTGIIVDLNRVPLLLGATDVPTGNAGSVENRGFEASLRYSGQAADLHFFAEGNFAFSRNKIIDFQEQEYPYPFNYRTGHPIGSQFGLQSAGFFKDEADIQGSPVQSYGTVRPGDLKYLDLTNDGKVDVNDVTCIGKSWLPETSFGLSLGLSYKGFDLGLLAQGAGNIDKKLSGSVFWEFFPNSLGKVMEHHLNRWAFYPELGIDTRATATYPRLSLEGDNTNNKAPNSDFWLKDASYLRLKSVEAGYSFQEPVLKYLHLSNLRIFITGYNLLTFDKIKVIDPESPGDGIVYPIQKMINMGVSVQF